MSATLFERNLRPPEPFAQASLEFEVEHLGHSVAVIRMRGEGACDRESDLGERLRSSTDPATRFVIVDLAEVSLVGPAALQTLAEFGREISRNGAEVWNGPPAGRLARPPRGRVGAAVRGPRLVGPGPGFLTTDPKGTPG
jgi:hypothetical protein